MKKIVSVMLMLVIISLGGNCMAAELTSVEDFLQKAGMDIGSIADTSAIEAFIQENDLDTHIFEVLPDWVVKNYAENLLAGLPISYLNVIEAASEEHRNDFSYADITSIFVAIQEDAGVRSLVIDKENAVAYLSYRGDVIEDVCYAEYELSLNDDMFNEILTHLEAENVLSFDREYAGDQSVRTAAQLALGADEGAATYTAYGLDNNAPDTYWEVCNWLFDYLAGFVD